MLCSLHENSVLFHCLSWREHINGRPLFLAQANPQAYGQSFQNALKGGASYDQALIRATAGSTMRILGDQVPMGRLLFKIGGDPNKAVSLIRDATMQVGIHMTPGELNLVGIIAAEASAYQRDGSFTQKVAIEMLKGNFQEQAWTAASEILWKEATDRVIAHGIADFTFGLDENGGHKSQRATWDEQIPGQSIGGVDRPRDGGYNNKKGQQSEAILATKNGQNESSLAEITATGIAEPERKGKKEFAASAIDEYNSRSTKDWAENIGVSSWEQAAQEEMLLAEYETIGESEETARLYDSSGGLILKKSGDDCHVEFSDEEVKGMNGCVLTHNHPNDSCFSPPDINMLRRGKLTEIRAVTTKGIYCLQNPTGKWKRSISNLEKIENAYYSIDEKVSMEFYNRARMGEITYAQAERLGQEGTIRELARRYGLSFKFDSWEAIRRRK